METHSVVRVVRRWWLSKHQPRTLFSLLQPSRVRRMCSQGLISPQCQSQCQVQDLEKKVLTLSGWPRGWVLESIQACLAVSRLYTWLSFCTHGWSSASVLWWLLLRLLRGRATCGQNPWWTGWVERKNLWGDKAFLGLLSPSESLQPRHQNI